jgi:nitrate reductase alpha subunit
MPMLVLLKEQNGTLVPDYFLRASHLDNNLDEANNPEWKTLVIDETTGAIVAPAGSIGFRWGETGKWNLNRRTAAAARPSIRCSPDQRQRRSGAVGFPTSAARTPATAAAQRAGQA